MDVRYIEQEGRYCLTGGGDLPRDQAEAKRDRLNAEVERLKRIKRDWAGTEGAKLRKEGWESVPVVDWDGTRYAILSQDTPHPGRNTAEVINVSSFDKDSLYKVVIDQGQRRKHTVGWAWVRYNEVGIGLMVERGHMPEEYPNPFTAVLTYRIAPPLPADVRQTAVELDDDLQESGPRL
jgi:hypothetical protein